SGPRAALRPRAAACIHCFDDSFDTRSAMTRRIRGARCALLVPFVVTLLAACSDDDIAEPRPTPETELAVVLNSVDRSLTVFAVDSPDARFTIGLGPAGTPDALAVRGARV